METKQNEEEGEMYLTPEVVHNLSSITLDFVHHTPGKTQEKRKYDGKGPDKSDVESTDSEINVWNEEFVEKLEELTETLYYAWAQITNMDDTNINQAQCLLDDSDDLPDEILNELLETEILDTVQSQIEKTYSLIRRLANKIFTIKRTIDNLNNKLKKIY